MERLCGTLSGAVSGLLLGFRWLQLILKERRVGDSVGCVDSSLVRERRGDSVGDFVDVVGDGVGYVAFWDGQGQSTTRRWGGRFLSASVTVRVNNGGGVRRRWWG